MKGFHQKETEITPLQGARLKQASPLQEVKACWLKENADIMMNSRSKKRK